ncbi:MAG TPA: c-type cytochrome [Acidobacteriota bacterium]|nr:c-type cytochrome [Acidobacteriota bacterium]HMZ78164.1 c-type cytochrome [Acidobacteriota bacterium]HNB71008.1 c-type cytochrome [Acidobacteriota bacterium]HNC42560.1 c-type cytochrome [Acidobacteriota bacterium]HND18353.1 c-type cytochrome [Acidobacteriota bacterium]
MLKRLVVGVCLLFWSAFVFVNESQSLISFSVTAAQNPPSVPAQEPTKTIDKEKIVQDLLKKIAGQENKPAEEVFKNIQLLKGIPAGRLVLMMNMGYSRALGVDCTHCHTLDQWEKDEKPEKLIAREMVKMTSTINNEQLKNIKNLKGPNPVINCTTCHRGQTKPALNLK